MFLVNSCLPQSRHGRHVRFHLCSFHFHWSYIPTTTRSCTFAYSMSWRCWVWCTTILHHDVCSLAFVHPSSMQLFLLVLHWVAGLSFDKKNWSRSPSFILFRGEFLTDVYWLAFHDYFFYLTKDEVRPRQSILNTLLCQGSYFVEN